MGLARLEITFEKSISPLELAQYLLALPAETQIVGFSEERQVENGYVSYIFIENDIFLPDSVIRADFIREVSLSDNKLKIFSSFKGLNLKTVLQE